MLLLRGLQQPNEKLAELMLTAATYDVADRIRSLELIDRHWR